MRGLLAGAVLLFGASLALSAYAFEDAATMQNYAPSGGAAMTPDSGTSGVGYGEY